MAKTTPVEDDHSGNKRQSQEEEVEEEDGSTTRELSKMTPTVAVRQMYQSLLPLLLLSAIVGSSADGGVGGVVTLHAASCWTNRPAAASVQPDAPSS